MILTAIPGQMIPRVQGFLDLFAPDKLVHLFIFGLLQWLLLKESGNGEKETRKDNIATTLIVSLGYAALTELLQWKLFINRQGSVWDFVADAVGILTGWLVYRYCKGFFLRNRHIDVK